MFSQGNGGAQHHALAIFSQADRLEYCCISNLSILPHIIPGHKVADVVAIMGSVDPVFGEVDR